MKRLVAGTIVWEGDVCAIGAVARKRGVDVSSLDLAKKHVYHRVHGDPRKLYHVGDTG